MVFLIGAAAVTAVIRAILGERESPFPSEGKNWEYELEAEEDDTSDVSLDNDEDDEVRRKAAEKDADRALKKLHDTMNKQAERLIDQFGCPPDLFDNVLTVPCKTKLPPKFVVASALRKFLGSKSEFHEEEIKVLNLFLTELDKGELDEAKLKRWQDQMPSDHFDEMVGLAGELGQTLPRYAVIGILKAGKSTLLNCLTGSDTFATGVVRCTAQEQSLEVNERIWVDTPGLDHSGSDDEIARRAIARADVILFVHNPKQGELDAVELKALRALVRNWTDSCDLVQRFVMVLTHGEECEPDQIDEVKGRIDHQIAPLIPTEVTFHVVKSRSYIKGMAENKPLLVNNSGIPKLNGILDQLGRQAAANKQMVIRSRLKNQIIQVRRHVEERLETINKNRDRDNEIVIARRQEFSNELRDANESIQLAWEHWRKMTRRVYRLNTQ